MSACGKVSYFNEDESHISDRSNFIVNVNIFEKKFKVTRKDLSQGMPIFGWGKAQCPGFNTDGHAKHWIPWGISMFTTSELLFLSVAMSIISVRFLQY